MISEVLKEMRWVFVLHGIVSLREKCCTTRCTYKVSLRVGVGYELCEKIAAISELMSVRRRGSIMHGGVEATEDKQSTPSRQNHLIDNAIRI